MTVDLDALEAAEKVATPGPWLYETNGWDHRVLQDEVPRKAGEVVVATLGQADRDSQVIVAARNALPSLVAELRLAREVVKAVRELGHLPFTHYAPCGADDGRGVCDCGRDALLGAVVAYGKHCWANAPQVEEKAEGSAPLSHGHAEPSDREGV